MLQALRPSSLGMTVPFVCATTLFALYLQGPGSLDYFIAAFIAAATALDGPNINSAVSRYLSRGEAPSTFASMQTVTNTLLMAAPLAAAYVMWSTGTMGLTCVISLVYVLGAVPWVILRGLNDPRPAQSTDMVSVTFLLRDPKIRGLLLARLLTVPIYSGLPVLLPILAARISSHDHATWIVADAITTVRAGLLGASLIGAVALAIRPKIIPTVAMWSPIIAGLVGLALCAPGSPVFLLGCCALAGACQFGTRITAMVIGPVITPVTHLSRVILASDTATRIVSAVLSFGLAAALAKTNLGIYLFSAWSLVGFLATALLKPAVDAYANAVRNNEHAC